MSERLFLLTAVILALPFAASAAESALAVKQPNPGKGLYTGNAAPLVPSFYLKLPIGSIKPGGWLKRQLELEAEGFSGRLGELSAFLKKENNAWLSPVGEGHSPWEEVPYWLKGYGDLGYVLGNKRIIDEARVWIEALFKSQRPNGYFGPESNLTNAGGKPDLWPNMLMLNVMMSYYEYSGDKRVLDFMRNYFRWQTTIPEKDFMVADGPGYWQNQRAGDNLVAIYWLYNRVKEPWLLELAEKCHRCTANWTDGVANYHGVNFAQSFREPTIYWQQSKQEKHRIASARNLNQMRKEYGQVPGGMYGADENARRGYADPRQATETCSFVEMMYADEMLFTATGELSWIDHCENVAFNSLPASMTADLKGLRYLTAPNQPVSDKGNKAPGIQNTGPMFHYDPYDHRCCQHNAAMGWPYLAEHFWMATSDNGLAAIVYSESAVKAKVGNGQTVTIKETTKYPFGEKIQLTIDAAKPARFPLYLRVPVWCASPKVSVNGTALKVGAKGPSLIRIERNWTKGDKVVLTLPMPITFTRWTENKNSVSVNRGPLTYSLKIRERYERDGGSERWPAFSVYPDSPWNYGLLESSLKPKDVKVVNRPWPKDNQPFRWDASPIELRLAARRIDAWTTDHQDLANVLQPSPAKSNAPTETIELIPMGCARLRISSFPTVSDAPGAKEWVKPKVLYRAKASFVHGADTVTALCDGLTPSSSADLTIPRFTWWDRKGSQEWVEYDFDEAKTVSAVEVYWFDDTGIGECRVPASWRLLYEQDGAWKEVSTKDTYGTAANCFNKLSFESIKTKKLRLEVQLQDNYSGGILEWAVK